MGITCDYAERMPDKMVQIRNMPESLHRKMKARAALAGMSLSEYLLSELARAAERPTRRELIERLGGRAPVRTKESAADVIRAERDRR